MEERVSTVYKLHDCHSRVVDFRPILFTFGPSTGPIVPLLLPPLFSSGSRFREITVLLSSPLQSVVISLRPYYQDLWCATLSATQTRRVTKMSAGGAFGGNRGMRPVPPEKGVFPLDHMHECDLDKKEYINCLKTSGYQSEICRRFSKKYLECRMEKNLMAKQDMSELGFGKNHEVENCEEKNEKIDDREAASPGVPSKTLAT